MPTIQEQDYLIAAKVFHWATQEHYKMWLTGRTNSRHRLTELTLPKLIQEGKLISANYGHKLIYAEPRRRRQEDTLGKLDHGLACTEGLVRLWRSEMRSVIITEHHFYGCGVVPEFGLISPRKSLLLFEYCSQDNFERTSRMISKINAYEQWFSDLQYKYKAENGMVLFVVNVSGDRIKRFLSRIRPTNLPCFFVDYKTFVTVPLGEQYDASIYIWPQNLETYALRKNERAINP